MKTELMIARISYPEGDLAFDLSDPIDLSLPMSTEEYTARAWYVPPVKIEPVMTDQFIGEVSKGGSVNFRDITFNPHGNGSHTECVGHISKEWFSVNKVFKKFFFTAELISIQPRERDSDMVIMLDQVEEALKGKKPEAVVFRTLPNPEAKQQQQYSNTNPPYLDHHAALFLRMNDVKHLLIDLPSVDREMDEGKLLSHHAFWNYPNEPRHDATITELIYVPDRAQDGSYMLSLQVAPFENDASPSRPVLYKLL